jgi:putative addiction module killer protein
MIQNTELEIRETLQFQCWFESLRDSRARARINIRLHRLSMGNLGDVKLVASGISELRIHYGPGYRVYFCKIAGQIVLLLAGGDKSSQAQDIANAIALAKQFKE